MTAIETEFPKAAALTVVYIVVKEKTHWSPFTTSVVAIGMV